MRPRDVVVVGMFVAAGVLSLAALSVRQGLSGSISPGEKDGRVRVVDGSDPGQGEPERRVELENGEDAGWDGAVRERKGGEVEAVAAELLEGYRANGDCMVVESGHLDFLGRAWGCVVLGGGWSEVCLVTEGNREGESVVVTWRIDTDDLRAP